MNLYTAGLLIVSATFIGACVSRPVPSPETNEEHAQVAPKMSWNIEGEFDDIEGPRNSVALVVGGVTTPLRKDQPVGYRKLSEQNWQGWGVPADAITACLGWWAGYGEVLYAVYQHPHVLVYFREVEEKSPLPDFRLIARIPVNPTTSESGPRD